PAGDDEWGRAAINRPLGPGDRLWADSDGRAEIQVGGAMLRLGADTAVSVLNLDDDITQLQLTEGSLNVRVRRLDQGQSVEVDTPHLAFTLREPGVYRIDVDAEGHATTIRMREGRGEVTGENASYLLDAPQVQRFVGDAQRDDAYASVPPPDDFDRWVVQRDMAFQTSVSARYVSPDVVGYEDLDDNGSWSVEASYGNIWYPSRVAVGWAPYRDGHWAWVDPWGWTWVDDAPWGYAVSHYGRWAYIRGRWGWVPGPVRTRAYYAPALVAFVGGPNFSLSISSGGASASVAWFPLGPREVYRPAYKVSATYFERVNVSNTVVNTTVVKNVYINKNVTNITYVNRRAPGAVVVVPAKAFAEAQPVAKVVVRAPKEAIEGRVVIATGAPAIVPTQKSLRGPTEAGSKPPAKAFARAVVARTQPPPPAPSFAVQQQRLEAKQGQPLDDDERKQLRAAAPVASASAAAPAAAVKVVAAAKVAKPQALPAQSAKVKEAGVATAEAGASKPAGERQAAASKPAAEERQAAASKPAKERQAAASKPAEEQQAAASKPDKERQAAASKPDKERQAAASKPAAEERQAGASKPAGERQAAANKPDRARPAASAGRGSEAEALDAVSEAQRRAPAAGRADNKPSAEERQAARAAARADRGASAADARPPRAQPGEATRPPPAESARQKPAGPGEAPAMAARAPRAPASAASQPKKKREAEGNNPS
ncbi:MAG TPA: DUF6600 domain-containing protein, partial [Ideonella sp.]|nr:DUF6600 domain-containing protein [Ideonella sp.]